MCCDSVEYIFASNHSLINSTVNKKMDGRRDQKVREGKQVEKSHVFFFHVLLEKKFPANWFGGKRENCLFIKWCWQKLKKKKEKKSYEVLPPHSDRKI